ncbi:MAG: Hydroxyacylglutathione hydrolase [Lentisphaerae bacterium ADurb.BinA184]|nr:MAG: Hydroxyacylglutathione hydrolase [Lentisphaerae bacterium ADurb.BinA184]
MESFGQQLLPSLYVVSWLGMTTPRLDCHVYVLRGSDGLLLVDCGTPWGYPRIVENMAHWGLRIEDVRTILLTHAHVDHVSGGGLFKRHGAEILCHREIASAVECQWETALGKDGDPTSWRIDGTLGDGDRIGRCDFAVEVLATPGHTRGCLSFLIAVDGQRCLFTGDLIMSNAWPGWHGDPGYCEADIVASLRRLCGVGFRHLCHGHDALLEDGGALFHKALAAYDSGAWDAPGSPLRVPVGGRHRAAP